LNKIKFNFKQKKITLGTPNAAESQNDQYLPSEARGDSHEPQILSGSTSLPKRSKLMIKQNSIKI